MMSILNFGSLNLDHVYSMPHFVLPGETLSSSDYRVYFGGKGLNQSVAAAKAGASVFHAGMVGSGGESLLAYLQECSVNTEQIKSTPVPQGHAIIQVSESGENSIILYHGSNFEVTPDYARQVLETAKEGDYLLLQNEISSLPFLVEEGFRRGLRIALNASPFEDMLMKLDYGQLSWLLINELEGMAMTGEETPEGILRVLEERYPSLGVVLTLGKAGAVCSAGGGRWQQGIFPVEAVDTTGAGDTFTGYFLAGLDAGLAIPHALKRAAAASAIAVTRKGAGPSIPTASEVDAFLAEKAE